MIELRVDFKQEALKRIPLLSPILLKNLDDAIRKAALLVEGTAKKKIQQGTRSGRFYARGRIIHRASAPGEPPKTDTGRLVGSIRSNFFGLMAEVGSDVKYSSALELGTSRMKPRPWLRASLDENDSRIQNLIDTAVDEALK